MNRTNVTAYTNDELTDLLNELNRGGFPFFPADAIREIRRDEDRMVYKNIWTDGEFRALIGRHLDFYGFDAE